MRIAVHFPMWGRLSLARVVLRQLRACRDALAPKHELVVVAAISEQDAAPIARELADRVVTIENFPVGTKHGRLLIECREIRPDAVVHIGSDDLVEPGLFAAIAKAIESGAGYVGFEDCWFLDVPTDRLGHFRGYEGRRAGEPIGAGRGWSAAFLDRMGWHLWDPLRNRGLDGSATQLMRRVLGEKGAEPALLKMTPGQRLVDVKTGQDLTLFRRICPDGGEHGGAATVARWFPAVAKSIPRLPRRQWTVGLDVLVRGDSTVQFNRMLETVKPHVDEITVLIDRRFGDQAEDVARWHGARVLDQPAPMFATKKADGFDHVDFGGSWELLRQAGDTDWAWKVDADEWLHALSRLPQAIGLAHERGDQGVIVDVMIDTAGGRAKISRQVRLIRRESAAWEWPVHMAARRLGGEPMHAVRTDAVIRTTYQGQVGDRFRRAEPALLKLYWESEDDRTREHAAWYLAKSYHMTGRWEETIRWCQICAELCAGNPARVSFWKWWAVATQLTKGIAAAEEVLDRAAEHHEECQPIEWTRLELAACRWAESFGNPRYELANTDTAQYLEGFPAAAKALGWPISIQVGSEG